MNKWIMKIEALARKVYYLDKLMEIYLPKELARGFFISEQVRELKHLYYERKCEDFISSDYIFLNTGDLILKQ